MTRPHAASRHLRTLREIRRRAVWIRVVILLHLGCCTVPAADLASRMELVRRQVLVRNAQGFYDSQATARALLSNTGAVSGIYTPAVVGLMLRESADVRLHDAEFNRAQANYVLAAMLKNFRSHMDPKVQYQGKPARMLFRRWVLIDLLATSGDSINASNKALYKTIFEWLDYRIGAEGLGNTANMKLLTALSRYAAAAAIPDFQPRPERDHGLSAAAKYLDQRLQDTFRFGPDEWASGPYGAQNLISLLTLARCGTPSGAKALTQRASAAFSAGLWKYAAVWTDGRLASHSERTYPSFLLPGTDQSGLSQSLWPIFGGWSGFEDPAATPGSMHRADSPTVFVAYALGYLAPGVYDGLIPPDAVALAAAERKWSVLAPRAGSERRCLSFIDWRMGFGVYSLWSQSGVDTISIPAGILWAARPEDYGRPANFWLGVLGAGLQTRPAVTDRNFAPTGTFSGSFVNQQIQRWGQDRNAFVLVADTVAGGSFARGPNGENHAFVTGYVPSQWLAAHQGSPTEFAADDSLAKGGGTATGGTSTRCYRMFLAFRSMDPAGGRAKGLLIAVTSSQPISRFELDGKGNVQRHGMTYANHSIFTDSSFFIDVPVVQAPDRRAVGVAVEAIELPASVSDTQPPLTTVLESIKRRVIEITQFEFKAETGVYGRIVYHGLSGQRVERSFDPSEPVPAGFAESLWEAGIDWSGGNRTVVALQRMKTPDQIDYADFSHPLTKPPLDRLLAFPPLGTGSSQ